MGKQTRYREPAPGPRRVQSGSGFGLPLVPVLGLVVLIGFAIFMARRFAGQGADEGSGADQGPAYVPFASVPDEAPPTPRAGGRRPVQDLAPAGLENNPTWQRALELAAQGAAALERSQAARAAEDVTATGMHARAARDAYHEAVSLSAPWMEELIERYTEDDRQVRQITRVRDGWFERLTALHKTTGR